MNIRGSFYQPVKKKKFCCFTRTKDFKTSHTKTLQQSNPRPKKCAPKTKHFSVSSSKTKRQTLLSFTGNKNFRGDRCTPIPPGPLRTPPPTLMGKERCHKVCFLTETHQHIWIIHSAYKHIKWNVAVRHLKAAIRPSQLIIKMSSVSGWTPALRSPPLVWWLYAQTIDKVSSYRRLRCCGLKRHFPSALLLCRICQGQKAHTPNCFSNSRIFPSHT